MVVAASTLFGAPAWSAGTPAGTSIPNTATVTFQDGSAIASGARFKADVSRNHQLMPGRLDR